MCRLCLRELHKFFHSRLHCALLCVLLLFPLLHLAFTLHAQTQERYALLNDKVLNAKEAKAIADDLRRSMSGTVQKSWIADRKQELEKLVEQGIQKEDIRYQTLDQAYWDGYRTMEMVDAIRLDPKTPAIVRHDLNTHQWRYGPYEGWMSRMKIFEDTAKLYALFCLFLFGSMFNQEESCDMLELLKSCRKGRRKLACAKLIVSFSLALMLAAALYIILSVSTSMILDLSGGDTTLMMLRTLHIYTFSQIDLQALGLLLLSGIACTLFAVFTSVIVKKPAVSLGLGMLFFLLPMLIAMDGLQTSWTSFFPSNFLSFRAIDQLMTTPWLAVLGNLYHRLPLLSVVWSFLCIVLIPVMIAKQSSIRSWSIMRMMSTLGKSTKRKPNHTDHNIRS